MKKRYIVIPLLIAVILFLTWKTSDNVYPIPELPAVATELGQYNLDNHRAIDIREEDGEIRYYEVTSDGGFIPAGGSGEVLYALRHIDSIKLTSGWSIAIEKPSTIVIQTGSGQTIRRKFGEQPPPDIDVVERRVITRKQMTDGFDDVISGEPKVVPADEVSSAE